MVNTIVPSAHALRNPTRPVQVSRPRKAGPSDASQGTQALLAAQTKQRKIELATKVDNFYTYHAEKIVDMALRFNKKEHEICVLLCNTNQLKAHRKPSVHKAVLHQRSLDLQEEGITKGLKELEANLNNDLESGAFKYSSIDKDKKLRLINQLLEHRHQTRTSMQATMKTAQIDTSNMVERIGNELMDLFERTGVRAFACFSCRHADDPSRAHSVDSDDALDFMLQGMDVTSQHFMRKFEQWSCNIDNGHEEQCKRFASRHVAGRHADDLSRAHSVDSDDALDFMLQGMDVTSQHFMRKFEQWSCNIDNGAHQAMKNNASALQADMSRGMNEHLHKITKNPKAKMDWVGYEFKIRGKYGVEIVSNIPIPRTRPATRPLETVLAVRNGLSNGTIDFVVMTRSQITALATEHKAAHAAGGTVSGRTGRKDKGGTHAPRKTKSTAGGGNKAGKTAADSDEDESSNGADDDDDVNSNSDDEEIVLPPALMTPGVGSMLSPVKVVTRPNPSVGPNQRSGSMPLSPRRVLLGRELMEALPPRPFNPAAYFTAVPISNVALDAVLTPVSNTVLDAALMPVPIINTTLDAALVPAPVSNAAPGSSPGPVPNPAPVPMPISNPIPNPAPVANPTSISTPAVNIAFIDDFSTLGLGASDSGHDPLFPHMLPLPPMFSGNRGWDMGMGTGMGSYGEMDYRSTMMPVLNMPPSSPTAAEKREREEDGEGDNQPAQKRRRKENTVATRGQRATRGSRGRVARGAHAA
ncbi:hypothetical protein B0H14DRAFT_3635976 [Mycena olivaceomarginata]|nr:hypothetical protein B0H14DRAFT_3635976 [Mycena olivaceomarginata]